MELESETTSVTNYGIVLVPGLVGVRGTKGRDGGTFMPALEGDTFAS